MNRFRRSMYHRLLALVLLGGIGTWVSAPLVSAHPQAAAAQVARTFAGGPLETAVAEALSVASQNDYSSHVFVEALRNALEAHPEGKVLAEFLAEHYSPELLLDLLVGQLLQSTAAQNPMMIAVALAQSAPGAVNGAAETSHHERTFAGSLASASMGQESADVPAVSIWDLSAAQPLGP